MEEFRANFDVIKRYLEKTIYFPQNIIWIFISNFWGMFYTKYEVVDLVDCRLSVWLGSPPNKFPASTRPLKLSKLPKKTSFQGDFDYIGCQK